MGHCPCTLAIGSERTGIQNKTAVNREYYPRNLHTGLGLGFGGTCVMQ